MSLKRFAMLAAISFNNNNQQNYNNNYNNNSSNNNNNTQPTTTVATQVATTFVSTTTTTAEPATKIINSNKSTLIQLKQRQQQQSQQIIAPKFQGNTNTTTSATTTTAVATKSQQLYTDKIITQQRNDRQQHHDVTSDDFTSDITDDSSFYSSESNESLDQNSTPDRRPTNTYTSTTYYGSGFGVFHQQNIRSNGGGIALITGNSGSNGLGGGSYSNGINNNVNLLLGGAMLTLITTILCVVCYCCHRNIKKRTEAAYRQQRQWLENDPNMEIYSVEQCYETSGLFVGDSMDGLATIPALHHEPPPSYDAVVAMQEQQQLLLQQQQLLMQQQLLQQQLPTNNSPPPGYRSSLDVSSMIQQGRGVLGLGGSIISGMEINSLASSTTNIRNASSHSPIDPLINYNDHNGNVATALQPITTATPTNTRGATASYLRNKQLQQQQRNLPSSQLSQLNMKKVLQAQSCCSLQRAEVENMWNAAAAALAARSSHLTSESRASTTASTSSPTLAMNTRKLSQGYSSTSKSNTPETFGSRYLKQNYYRKGCPLCGKFRYDNDSTLSISMESNLDTLATAVAEDSETNEQEESVELVAANDLNANNNNDNLENSSNNSQNVLNNNEENDIEDEELEDEEYEEHDNDVEQQCSCSNSKRKQDIKLKLQKRYHKVTTQENNNESREEQCNDLPDIPKPTLITTPPVTAAEDANANCGDIETEERQSTTPSASNNNHEISIMDLPTTSANALSIPHSELTAAAVSSCSSVSSISSTASTPINLDCINENGIISLDMSKIIDKTGLPTYDAALKLESSGYV